MQMLRQDNYVAVRYDIESADDDFEIYDVIADPGQRTDLASQLPELQATLKARVLQGRRANNQAKRPYDSVPVPALATVDKTIPLTWQFYASVDQKPFAWVPSEVGLKQQRQGVGQSLLQPTELVNQVGVTVYRGLLQVPREGKYRFELQSSTKLLARLHEACLIDADARHQPDKVYRTTIRLAAGLHPITVRVLEPGTERSIDFRWSGPDFELRPLTATDFASAK